VHHDSATRSWRRPVVTPAAVDDHVLISPSGRNSAHKIATQSGTGWLGCGFGGGGADTSPGRLDAHTMDSTTANVVLFAFRDPSRTAQVVAAAGGQSGVRSVAVVGRAADCEIRIIGRVGEGLTDARWLAYALAVLDVLSVPLAALAGSPEATEAATLPDSADGFAAFGRLVPPGALVILVAVCDDSDPSTAAFESRLGPALFRMPADCAIRLSSGTW
jgi:hypothetical protein